MPLKKTLTNDSSAELNQKTLLPKIAKDQVSGSSSSATAASTENSIYPSIVQAAYVDVAKRAILVVCTTKGIFVSIFFKSNQIILFY